MPTSPSDAPVPAESPAPPRPEERTDASASDDRRLVLSDLLNRVLDRGLVVTGSVTIAVADVDLVRLDLNLVLTAIETAFARSGGEDR